MRSNQMMVVIASAVRVAAPDLAAARAAIEAALPEVHWPGMQVRRDIGLKALRHAEAGRTVQDPW